MSLTLPVQVYALTELIERLNALALRYGLKGIDVDPVELLQDFVLVDTDRIRFVGEQVWGTPERAASAAKELTAWADRLMNHLLITVQDRWTGSAYTAFQARIRAIKQEMEAEAARMPLVGAALVSVADAMEVTWMEILSWVLSTIGMMMSLYGLMLSAVGMGFALVTAPTGVLPIAGLIVSAIGLALALVSLIFSAVGLAMTYLQSALPRLEAIGAAESAIAPSKNPESRLDGLSSVPGLVSEWDPRSADPYS